MKKLCSLFLVALLVLSTQAVAFATTTENVKTEKPYTESQEFCDAVNQYIIDCGLAYSYCFEKDADGNFTNMFTVSDINIGDPVTIYSETADYVVFGIMGVMNANSKETIGNYEFKNSNLFHSSNPCGYCVYNGDKLYSISDAVSNNIIDVEALASVIPNTTEINKPTTPQPTKPIVKNPKISAEKVKLKAGQTKALKVTNGKVKSWQTKNKKIATVSNGRVVALQKGKVKIVATLTDGKKLTCTVTVTNTPKLNKATVNVKKGKTVSVKLSGKASSINNKYTNTKNAKIISKPKSNTLKIKGLKKGTTTLKVKVNGVKVLKLKVNVK